MPLKPKFSSLAAAFYQAVAFQSTRILGWVCLHDGLGQLQNDLKADKNIRLVGLAHRDASP